MSFSGAELEALIPRLRRYAHALARHPVRADDLVQDALERAWSRRGQWQHGTDLRAWTFTIMHNVFISDMRRGAIRGHDHGDGGAEFLADPQVDTAKNTALLLDLERALASLPADQRTVVLLVGLEDFGYREVADILGIPIGTVMSRLSRGRVRLRVLMEGIPETRDETAKPLQIVR